jgi:surface protein
MWRGVHATFVDTPNFNSELSNWGVSKVTNMAHTCMPEGEVAAARAGICLKDMSKGYV